MTSSRANPSKSPRGQKPLIGVISSLSDLANGRFKGYVTGAKNVDTVEEFSDCVPIILPCLGERMNAEDVVSRIDGLLLTGGRANVEPHHFGGQPFPDTEVIDPARDHTALPLVRACVEAEVPVFGICRGIQEMNVALGGTLHYRIHMMKEFGDHRMPQWENPTPEEVFRLRHTLTLSPGGLFAEIMGERTARVNSLHGQGVAQLAPSLQVEAVAEDGVIEAVRLKNDPSFTVGVQWHAEWKPGECHLAKELFRRFGEAARERAERRLGTAVAA